LQDHEEQRLQYPNASAFLQALLQLDLKDEQEEEEEEEGDDGERDDRNDEGDVKATNVTDAEPEEGVDDDDDDNQEDPSNKDTTLPPQNKNSNKKKKKARITKRKKSSTSSYSKNKKRKQSQPKPPKDRIPESELARVTAIHSLALGPLPKIKQQQQQQHGDEQQPRSSQDRVVVESSDHNNHNDESDDNTTNNTTTNDTRAATSQWLFIGKPVKLYCPLGNGYHNGRIVSARRRNLWSQLSNNDVDDGDDNDQGAAAAAATSSNAITEDDWVDEYLIRFHAGLDGRKTTLHWWVVLEEHSLAVATTLIWGDFGNKNGFKGYKPGRLWVRTTRELLPVRHLLREELGQVVFMETNKSSTATTISRASNSKKRTLCWGLAQSFGDFGDDGFKVLHLQNSATDLFSPHLATFMSPQHQQQPSKSPRNSRGGSKTTGEASIVTGSTTAAATSFHASLDGTTSSWRRVRELEYAQACAEREEQKRVYEWNQRRLENPAMEKALSCLDEQRLGALTFVPSKKREGAKNYKVTTIDVSRYHADLVPLIPRGLDRSFIMKFLERNCDMIGSKDVAASLSCEAVMSIPAALQSMRDKRREPERNETEVRELSN
jgi:Arc/MetJ-type ribon-helix-helix transcriptional regulator